MPGWFEGFRKSFNSRLREEATAIADGRAYRVRVSTHASVRRRQGFRSSPSLAARFNSRLREEATWIARR